MAKHRYGRKRNNFYTRKIKREWLRKTKKFKVGY